MHLALYQDEAQPVRNPFGMRYQQIPRRRHEQRQQKDEISEEPQIRAGQRREIVVVRLLHEVEYAGREYHRLRRGVAEDNHASLEYLRGGGVGTLCVAEFRERIVPAALYQALGETLLSEGQGVYVDRAYLFAEHRDVFSVGDAVDVGKDDIRLRETPDCQFFKGQPRVAYPAADEGRVSLYGFDEAVVSSSEDAVVLGLLDAARRVAPHVEDYSGGAEILEEHSRRAGHYLIREFSGVRLYRDFGIRNIFRREFLHALRGQARG